MKLSVLHVTVCTWTFSAALAQAACVTNETDRTLYFTIDSSSGGDRQADFVKPGGEMCLPDAQGQVFRVFASVDDIEGCSRIVGPSGRDSLLDFQSADNCRWASHGD
ncbi:MAG: hypothetical protein B7Z02_03135 [Rhodobacterales bacterium 32-67-9]|nr:MAG: hypothetical protein B7Z02_03135 [Rhodobacterales bacterium 32-67-9]